MRADAAPTTTTTRATPAALMWDSLVRAPERTRERRLIAHPPGRCAARRRRRRRGRSSSTDPRGAPPEGDGEEGEHEERRELAAVPPAGRVCHGDGEASGARGQGVGGGRRTLDRLEHVPVEGDHRVLAPGEGLGDDEPAVWRCVDLRRRRGVLTGRRDEEDAARGLDPQAWGGDEPIRPAGGGHPPPLPPPPGGGAPGVPRRRGAFGG